MLLLLLHELHLTLALSLPKLLAQPRGETIVLVNATRSVAHVQLVQHAHVLLTDGLAHGRRRVGILRRGHWLPLLAGTTMIVGNVVVERGCLLSQKMLLRFFQVTIFDHHRMAIGCLGQPKDCLLLLLLTGRNLKLLQGPLLLLLHASEFRGHGWALLFGGEIRLLLLLLLLLAQKGQDLTSLQPLLLLLDQEGIVMGQHFGSGRFDVDALLRLGRLLLTLMCSRTLLLLHQLLVQQVFVRTVVPIQKGRVRSTVLLLLLALHGREAIATMIEIDHILRRRNDGRPRAQQLTSQFGRGQRGLSGKLTGRVRRL